MCTVHPGTPLHMDISIQGDQFVDTEGRALTLRGVNLGGDSKMPADPDGSTHTVEGFYETMRTASFVGRPFPLAEADEHFRRLRAWGVNVLRFITTWEAVEHAGPGEYDEEYVAYFVEVIARARDFGMAVYVDPHQDVWSRFSGGDGAPGWTFEKVGLDVRAFAETGAALVHQCWKGDPASFPRMAWPTNLHKLACATMFTLFWAGDTFAPNLLIDGEPAQRYLQGHYTRAMCHLAKAVRHLPNVLGFGTMNEPLTGYIGVKRLDRLSGPLKNDLMPTPFDGMALGSGHVRSVGRFRVDSLRCLVAGLPVSTEVVNRGGRSAWLPGHECVWKQHGVWAPSPTTGKPTLLRPDYFTGHDFGAEFYLPFTKAYMRELRAAGNPRWVFFLEMPPADLGLAEFPKMDVTDLGGGVIHAPHWYDQLTLFFGKFLRNVSLDVQSGSPALGQNAVARLRARQLADISRQAATHVSGAPTFIGEVGIPFDMHDREAYAEGRRRTLRNCSAALTATVNALEENNLSYSLWCYAASHSPDWGDRWNREDLSVFSRGALREVDAALDPADVHRGGRALRAWVRPYVWALAGRTTRTPKFKPLERTYTLHFRHDPNVYAPTLIYVPEPVQYPDGFSVTTSDGSVEIEHKPLEEGGYAMVRYSHDASVNEHALAIIPKGGTLKAPRIERFSSTPVTRAEAGTARASSNGRPARMTE